MITYKIKIQQKEPSRIPPYTDLSGEYEMMSEPGVRKHLAWIKTFCVAHGAVATITRRKQ